MRLSGQQSRARRAAEAEGAWVYFPTSAMASCVRHLNDGIIIEVGIIGFKGVVGVESLFGATSQPNAVTAQVAGEVFRVALAPAKKAFDQDEAFPGSCFDSRTRS